VNVRKPNYADALRGRLSLIGSLLSPPAWSQAAPASRAKRYFGGALGGVGETAGVAAFGTGFLVALAAPSQSQASARR